MPISSAVISGDFFEIFKNGKRIEGILVELGIEYFVKYDKETEIEIEKKRTFQVVRIMIVGCKIFLKNNK